MCWIRLISREEPRNWTPPPWKGPGIIVERLSPYIYGVRFENVVAITNHDRMKKCNDRHLPSWLSVAKQKLQEGENLLDVSKENTPYCICRQPDDGSFMIHCDRAVAIGCMGVVSKFPGS
jgi:hypothetical protein